MLCDDNVFFSVSITWVCIYYCINANSVVYMCLCFFSLSLLYVYFVNTVSNIVTPNIQVHINDGFTPHTILHFHYHNNIWSSTKYSCLHICLTLTTVTDWGILSTSNLNILAISRSSCKPPLTYSTSIQVQTSTICGNCLLNS
jgi:hypothetical protein